MSTSGAIDLPLQVFGSYCPELLPADLPPGLSPWNQDIEYIRGGIKTRPGLSSQFSIALGAGNPSVNYLKSYITPTEVLRLLALDSLGNVYKETPLGTINNIIGNVVPGSFGKSTTCFGREYIAFSDGSNGLDMPRQYDDTNFDRVSQVGPGAVGTVTDEAPYTIDGTAGAASQRGSTATTSLTFTNGIVTVTAASSIGFGLTGESVVVAGVTPSTYNGTFKTLSSVIVGGGAQITYALPNVQTLGPATVQGTVTSQAAQFELDVLDNTQQLVTFYQRAFPSGLSVTVASVGVAGYNGTWTLIGNSVWNNGGNNNLLVWVNLNTTGLGISSGGTLTVNGNISAGVHQVSDMFVTRQGYITAPAPPISWTAAGGKRAVVTGLPIGPPNITQRILTFTATGGANFFYTGSGSPIISGNMIIGDNSTTTAIVDFTDAVLLAGINVDENFNFVELGECLGVIDYADRLFWWGERNKLQNLVNLSFDGGFNGNVPLGWTSGGVAGGSSTTVNAYWGFAYAITGDGLTSNLGLISQSAALDFRGVQILNVNTAYSLRVRLKRSGSTPTQGSFTAVIFSPSAGTLGTLVFNATAVTTSYTEFIGSLLNPQTSIPADTVLQIYAGGSLTNGTTLFIDNIQLFPTNTPFNLTTVRGSFNPGAATGGPEAYDGVSGLVQPQPYDGQAIRCVFKLREFLYIVKERSIYATQDDGVNEPAGWSIRQISGVVGTQSVNGVAIGEDWAVIVSRYGLYMFTGGEPVKISQEIQSNQTDIPLLYFWDNVNWSSGQFSWSVVDLTNKRIAVGLPFGGATSPNGVFYLDYRPMNTGDDIASSAPIHTSYAGRVINYEHARKWSPWSMSIPSAAMIERGNGTAQLFLGGSGNGLIFGLSESQLFDSGDALNTTANGVAINSFYVPYGFPSHDEEAGLQIGSHRKDFTLMTGYVEGTGNLGFNFLQNNPAATPQKFQSWPLDIATTRDHEQQLHVICERAFFKLGTNAVGSFFKLQKLVVSLKPSTIPVRGII